MWHNIETSTSSAVGQFFIVYTFPLSLTYFSSSSLLNNILQHHRAPTEIVIGFSKALDCLLSGTGFKTTNRFFMVNSGFSSSRGLANDYQKVMGR